jgi:hypothetical protein
VTSDWSDHVANGEAFCAEDLIAPGGGLVGHVQLFNPVASGRRVRVRYVEGFGLLGAAVNNNVRRYDTALTNLGPFYGPANLLGGGPAPLAQLRNQAFAGVLGTAFWLLLSPLLVTPNFPPIDQEWGHDLLPGQGVLLNAGAGVSVFATFQWAEVPL